MLIIDRIEMIQISLYEFVLVVTIIYILDDDKIIETIVKLILIHNASPKNSYSLGHLNS